MKRSISKIIRDAVRNKRVSGGLVLCENCDTPASKDLSQSMSWTGCAPCMTGESDSFDDADLIAVEQSR